MKVDIEDVESTINSMVEDPNVRAAILEEIRRRVAANTTEPREPDNTEKRNVVMILCPEEEIERARSLAENCVAYAFQIEAEQDPNQVPQALFEGAINYNSKKKRDNSKVISIGAACAVLSPKNHLGGFPKKIFTKESAWIIASANTPVPLNPLSQGG